jgi:hypothetical protein
MDDHELGPRYTWQAAVAAGLTRAQLRDDGIRTSRGAYVSRAVPLTLRNACLSVVPVLPDSAKFSHLTAAALLGAPVQTAWPLAVAVPRDVYRPRRRNIRVHVRDLLLEDAIRCHGLPVTSGAQTWLDLAGVLSAGDLVAVGDALFRAGHLDAGSLGSRLARAGGTRGIVRARELADILTPHAASRPESLIRFALISSDLPDPDIQVPIHDRRGRVVAHADLGYPEWRIAIEYEGRQHAQREQFGRDIDRYSLMAASGWLVLRFARGHLGRDRAVVDRVAGALRSRGARW